MWLLFSMALAGTIDRVVAVVGDAVVLQSDERLDAELAPLDMGPTPFWTRGEASARQLDAAVILQAAGDIALYNPPDDLVRQRVAALRAGFTPDAFTAFLLNWGLTERQLFGVLRRRMRVEAYLLRNIAAPPTSEDAFNQATEATLQALRARTRIRRTLPDDPILRERR